MIDFVKELKEENVVFTFDEFVGVFGSPIIRINLNEEYWVTKEQHNRSICLRHKSRQHSIATLDVFNTFHNLIQKDRESALVYTGVQLLNNLYTKIKS